MIVPQGGCAGGDLRPIIDETLDWLYSGRLALQWARNFPAYAEAWWNFPGPNSAASASRWFGAYSETRVDALISLFDYVIDRYTSSWRPLLVGLTSSGGAMWKADPDGHIFTEGRIEIAPDFWTGLTPAERRRAWLTACFRIDPGTIRRVLGHDPRLATGTVVVASYSRWLEARFAAFGWTVADDVALPPCPERPAVDHPCFILGAPPEPADYSVEIEAEDEQHRSTVEGWIRSAHHAVHYASEFLKLLLAAPDTTRRVMWQLGYNCGLQAHGDLATGRCLAGDGRNPSPAWYFGSYEDSRLLLLAAMVEGVRQRFYDPHFRRTLRSHACVGPYSAYHLPYKHVQLCPRILEDETPETTIIHEYFHWLTLVPDALPGLWAHGLAGLEASPIDRHDAAPCYEDPIDIGPDGIAVIAEDHKCYGALNARRLVNAGPPGLPFSNVDNYAQWVWAWYRAFGPCIVPKGCAYPASDFNDDGGHAARCRFLRWAQNPPHGVQFVWQDPMHAVRPVRCCGMGRVGTPFGWDEVQCPATPDTVCDGSTRAGPGIYEGAGVGPCPSTEGGGSQGGGTPGAPTPPHGNPWDDLDPLPKATPPFNPWDD